MATDENCQTWTVPEFAERVGISPAAAYRLCQRGVIPSFRLGRTVRISRAWTADYLDGRAHLLDSIGV